MKRVHALIAAAFVLSMVTGCSAKESVSNSELAVDRFHQQFNASRFDEIYSSATDDFRNAAPKKDYDEFMAAVRRKLGRAGASERQQWFINVTLSGKRVTFTYATQFEFGKGQEHFAFIDKGSGPKLLAYTVNSNALVTR